MVVGAPGKGKELMFDQEPLAEELPYCGKRRSELDLSRYLINVKEMGLEEFKEKI